MHGAGEVAQEATSRFPRLQSREPSTLLWVGSEAPAQQEVNGRRNRWYQAAGSTMFCADA